MKVRVKDGKSGFIYGTLRTEGTEFTLKKVKRSDGTINEIENQFSKLWMEDASKPKEVEEEYDDEPKDPSEMTANELREALDEAGINYPNGSKKSELLALLEE